MLRRFLGWEMGIGDSLSLCLTFGFVTAPGEYCALATRKKQYHYVFGPDCAEWDDSVSLYNRLLVDVGMTFMLQQVNCMKKVWSCGDLSACTWYGSWDRSY